MNVRRAKSEDLPATIGFVRQARDELRADMRAIESRLSSKIEGVVAAVHGTQVLMEEQRSENRIVLDGLKLVLDRQDRLEKNFSRL